MQSFSGVIPTSWRLTWRDRALEMDCPPKVGSEDHEDAKASYENLSLKLCAHVTANKGPTHQAFEGFSIAGTKRVQGPRFPRQTVGKERQFAQSIPGVSMEAVLSLLGGSDA